MPAPEDPRWKEWLVAENALEEARDQLRTVEHLDLGDREFQEAWVLGSATLATKAVASSGPTPGM